MLAVCQECFGGDWQAMLEYAKRYDADKRERDNALGKPFRKIIGTRNRTTFWESVTNCEAPAASGEVIVDGDSLRGVQRAIRLCTDGSTVAIESDGKIIGRLIPADHRS
jgi:hypothetical protein